MTKNELHFSEYACQVCERALLKEIKGFSDLPRITSDCQAFCNGGELFVCMHCSAVQKVASSAWLSDINKIYSNYQTYRIADGDEQSVLDAQTGLPKKRSIVLLEHLKEILHLPLSPKIIDIGCGNGVTLNAMSSVFPSWQLYAHELDASKTEILKKIKGFQHLFTGHLENIDDHFHLTTMIHSLEHFPAPLTALKQLKNKVTHDGYLFIQVCNVEENPFDILVADHLMHFNPLSLQNIVKNAGFYCLATKTDWVKKEISLLASTKNEKTETQRHADPNLVYNQITNQVNWLRVILQDIKKASYTHPKFGIFGTSIAASWINSQIADQINFFVDEDPCRIGRTFMDKPVYSPADVPKSSHVYLALAPTLSRLIVSRLRNTAWSFIEAPAL